VAVLSETDRPAPQTGRGRAAAVRIEERIRAIPIRWRILAITVLNAMVVLLLAALIWDGARMLTAAWNDLRQARESDQVLVSLESETVRLQSLIHRYFNQPQPALLAQIEERRRGLLDSLKTRAAVEPAFSGSLSDVIAATERFLAGFSDLRRVRAAVSRVYEQEILGAAREMAAAYAKIEGETQERNQSLWPVLSKSREAFSAALMSANAFYLSLDSAAAVDAYKQIEAIEGTIPTLTDLSENDSQRAAIQVLAARSDALRSGLDHLANNFVVQAELLRDAIDGNQLAMVAAIEGLSTDVRAREREAQARFNQTLNSVYLQIAGVAIAFLGLIIGIGLAISSSISRPLGDLRTAMYAIVSGDYDRRVRGIEARDEIGDMARAVEVFRENAVARRRAEDELRASKERAESALADLRATQQSLIEAEKLAALGGLVAGVAHEVNNPVGISLTVASSLARRCDSFAEEIKAGQLRRARLEEFIGGSREAAKQLVSNLERAGDLIQSFKQVAVDRSHEQRRQFDLRQSTSQIVASLRPGLKRAQIELVTEVPEHILLDSYPGAYGQVLTNLVLNAVNHGFADVRRGGAIRLVAERKGDSVEIVFSDDGVGMSEEVQRRAFDPFFTTRRSQGGTGLGLHIVYNIVTRRLGGKITLSSVLGRGTSFRIVLPLAAPGRETAAPDMMAVSDR
jgi:signal transduction histidine kinase